MRICSSCGKRMTSGYVDDDNYYCSDDCLHIHYSDREWEALCKEYPDQCYWTEWEEAREGDDYFEHLARSLLEPIEREERNGALNITSNIKPDIGMAVFRIDFEEAGYVVSVMKSFAGKP